MAGPIHDVLLRIVGDEDDARDSLEKISAELEAFNRLHASADVDLDTDEAHARLELLEDALEDLDDHNVDPKIEVDIAAAMAEVAAIRAVLEELDNENIEIDIEVRRDLLDRIQSLVGGVNALRRASELAADEQKSFGARILDSAVHLGPFTTQVRVAIPLVFLLSSVVSALVGGVVALVGSLGAAVAGIGALAIAAGGILAPAIGLVVATIQRFKAQSEKAGTPAHALAKAFEEVQKAARAFARAADPVLRGLAEFMQTLPGFIRAVVPAFKEFARSARDAIGVFTDLFSDATFREGWAQLIEGAAQTLRPMARIAAALARVFLNIANAAMPFLRDGLRAVADATEDFASSTDNALVLSGVIGTLMDHLQSWLSLIGALSRLMLNFFAATAGPGRELVDWLAEGANKLADWAASEEGREQIASWLDDVLPLFKEIVVFVGELILALIQLGQSLAPVFTPFMQALNGILRNVNQIIALFNKLPAPIRELIGLAAAFLLPWRRLRFIIVALTAIFQVFGDDVGGVLSFIGSLLLLRMVRPLKSVIGWLWKLTGGAVFAKIAGAFRGLAAAAGGAIIGLIGKLKGLLGTLKVLATSAIFSQLAGSFRSVGAQMIALAARAGPIGLLIAALIILIVKWEDVKEAVNDAKDAITDFFNKKFLDPTAMNDALDRVKEFARQAERAARAGGAGKIAPAVPRGGAAGAAGKVTLHTEGGGAGKGTSLTIPINVPGGGPPDPDALGAALARRLRAKGLSLA